MNLLILLATTCLTAAPSAHAEATKTDARELARQLKQVTAEADALWRYVISGPDNPDVAALERAANLYDLRRARRKD